MATLTSYEKEVLDRGIYNYLEKILYPLCSKEDEKTIKIPLRIFIDLYENILSGIRCSLYSLKPCLQRVTRTLSEKNESGYVISWDVDEDDMVIFEIGYSLLNHSSRFKKDKNILHFECMPNLTYDFITKSFNMPLFDIRNSEKMFTKTRLEALKYEWLFNYIEDFVVIDQIIRDCPLVMYETMPRDLLKNIAKYDYNKLSAKSLAFCYCINIFGKYTRFALESCNITYQNIVYFDKKFFEDLTKVITISIIEEGFYAVSDEIEDLVDCYIESAKQEIVYQLDTNRTLETNINNIRNLMEANRNKILEKQLRKLNFIHEKEFGDYIVIVPQTQEDKIEEGRQQNNCVGSYYDSSIISGDNFIFFLRKKDNPTKSYITCRYFRLYGEVVEARKKNNYSIGDVYEVKLIREISNYIKERLE